MNRFGRIILSLLLGVVFILNLSVSVYAAERSLVVPILDYENLIGSWQRTDGNYLLKVSGVQTDGQVQVEYFNPRPINIADAAVSTQKGMIKLYVRFHDTGYEGSTYTLYYYAEKDALAGFYYQAPMDRTFEVIFFRRPDSST